MKKIIVLLALFSGSTAFCQDKPTFITDSLDIYIERSMEASDLPGLAICIVKDGEVVVMKGYGVRELGKKAKVDEHTLFMIASNTKAFTGTAVALLAHEKKCSMDDKVKHWVPHFTMMDKWVEQNVTLTDVLCHRVGYQTFQGDFMTFNSTLTRKEAIEKMGMLKPKYAFRTRWGYYNTGFLIAGEAIESISGQSWQAFLQARFFNPLEMDETIALASELQAVENKAYAHGIVNDKMAVVEYSNFDMLAPAGAISSSVNDMSHWILMHLGEGVYKGNEVIPYKALKRTYTPTSVIGNGNHPFSRNHFSLYGLGWKLWDYEGYKIISHTGGLEGALSSVVLVPEAELGIVVLTNSDANSLFTALASEIIDAYLNLPYQNYAQFMRESREDRRVRDEARLRALKDSAALNYPTTFPLIEYTGRYIHDAYGWANIELEDNNLVITFQNHPKLTGTLESMGDDDFLCTFSSPTYGVHIMPFRLEPGTVAGFTLKVNNFVEYSSYHFKRE